MGNTTINNFVAQHISKELAEKILSKTYLKQNANIIVHINQNIGDDSSADGSEQRPFKTFEGCCNYLQNNFITSHMINIYIYFDTDYTTTYETYFYVPNISTNYLTKYNVLANGHNVTLQSISTDKCNILFDGITFKGTHNSYCLQGGKSTLTILKNCTLEQTTKNTNYLLLCNYWGEVQIENGSSLTIKLVDDGTIGGLISCYTYGYLRPSKNNSLIIKGNTNIKNQFFNVGDYGICRISGFSNIIVDQQLDCKKFKVFSNGILDLGGKGTEIIPANQDGEVLSQGQVI